MITHPRIQPRNEVEQELVNQFEQLLRAARLGQDILVARDNNCAEIVVDGVEQQEICGRDLIFLMAYLIASEFIEA